MNVKAGSRLGVSIEQWAHTASLARRSSRPEADAAEEPVGIVWHEGQGSRERATLSRGEASLEWIPTHPRPTGGQLSATD